MKYSKPEVDGETAIKLWYEEHSDYAKEQVILNNIGLVGIVIKHFHLDLQDEDLFQTGVAGLIIAINTFDHSKGFKFSAYATTVVRNEILLHLRRDKKRIVTAISLDERFSDEEGDGALFENIVSSGERFEDLSILKLDLDKTVGQLSERERFILKSLASEKTQSSIAKEIGTSRENVRRILNNIREKVRIGERR